MSDYAVAVPAELARVSNHAQSSTEAALGNGLPQPTVRKLLKSLARAGLVRSARGAQSGYRLGRDPEAIPIQEIIEVFDGPLALTECQASAANCDRLELCDICKGWGRIHAAVRQSLARCTLADMLSPVSPGAKPQAELRLSELRLSELRPSELRPSELRLSELRLSDRSRPTDSTPVTRRPKS
jgi:FeS assembly SUF system regulator